MLLKLIVCFIFGIIISAGVLSGIIESVLLSVFFVLLSYLLIFNRVSVLFAVFCCWFMTFGMLAVDCHLSKIEALNRFDKSKVSVCGAVYDVRHDGSVLLRVKEVDSNPVSFNMLMRFSDVDGNVFSYGDVITAVSSFNIPGPAEYYGDFAWDVYYMARGIYAAGTSSSVKMDVQRYNGSIAGFSELGFRLRNKFSDFIAASLPLEEANVLTSILFGSKIYDDDYFYDKVKYIGAAHALAISGFNVGIVIVIFTSIFKVIFWEKRVVNIICILVLVLLYFIIGYSPPVSRAIIMGIVNLAGALFLRKSEKYTTLAISAFCILLFYPMTLFDVSFILSFVSSFFIMSFAQNNFSIMTSGRVYSFILDSVSLCFFCSLGNIPITAYFFNTLSVGGVLSDILVVPLVGVIVCLGYLFSLLGVLIPPAAALILYPVYILLYLLRMVVEVLGDLPYLTIEVPSPSVGFIILYYFLTLLIFEFVSISFEFLKQKKVQK